MEKPQQDRVLTTKCFDKLKAFSSREFNIQIPKTKRGFLDFRLQRLFELRHLKNFDDYLFDLSKKGDLYDDLIEMLTINHSYFYRESDHFEFLKSQALPEILKRNKDVCLKIWSAGCSTGEEPYTISMVLQELIQEHHFDFDFEILATDISMRSLIKAKEGTYSSERIKNMPDVFKQKAFLKLNDKTYQVKNPYKEKVLFKRLNLLGTLPFKGKFHFIFCRNVMIYFSDKTNKELLSCFYDKTHPQGYLFTGHSESFRESGSGYEYVMPALYRKG